jgi:adenylate cyclase
MGKLLTSTWIAAVTLLLLVTFRVWDPTPIETLRLKGFDYLQSTEQTQQSKEIVLLDIGEASLEAFGQWPWPRDYFANIMMKLRENGAQLITFVVFFPEQDRMGKDQVFADILAQDPYTMLAQTATDRALKTHGKHIAANWIGDDPTPWLYSWPGLVKNIDLLENSAKGVGMVAVAPEVDNLVRRLPLVVRIADQIYPNLAIEFIRVATGDPGYQIKTGEGGVQAVRVPGFNIVKTDPHTRMWIDYNKTFDRIEVSEEDWSKVNGKHVFIGTTAAGLANFISTPNGLVYPHEIQASLVQTILDGTFIQRQDFMNTLEAIVFAIFGVILLVVVPRTSVLLTVPVLLVYLGSVAGYTYYEWTGSKTLVDATFPMAAGFLLFAHLIYNNFAREFRQKMEIKKQFAGYCSPEVVKILQTNPDLIKKGVKKDVSVMFSDLRGFTPIGEHYGDDVKGLGDYMNGYMDSITKPILDKNGMVIKYVGDASMHIHGAPIDDPNHAHTCVDVGLKMIDAVEKYSAEMVAQGLPKAEMGFGINTGEGFIGEMGSSARHSYDILGDMVSTAARLEARCKAYGVLCIIGAETYNRTKDDFFYLFLDNLQPKGKSTPDFIYTALSKHDWAFENTNWFFAQDQHNKMHELYKSQQFDLAIHWCNDLRGEFDGKMDKYYDIWIERCELMKTQDLPKDWNGAFVATEK